ncbi:uncharacterized protein LOC100573823 [Acyrthosiphon pisum]|uniref:Uncharacterized protein n=1 Tax=Acyrthosiphon pisum TaxID=7029 RepID=A0A8R2JR03_ACYPI|nr:uncharacterized protein LOC100573823 [Acyrthosiphon pisum]
MFLNRALVTFALVLTTVVLTRWYVLRNRKIRREILESCRTCKNKNNSTHGFDDQLTKDNLSVILKGNRFVLFFIGGLILLGYFLRMLPTGFTSHLLLFLILVYTFHTLMSKCYAINVIWCHGIISINADIDIALFPKLRILKIFQLRASGETTT